MRQIYLDIDPFAMQIMQEYCAWVSFETARAGYMDKKQISSVVVGDALYQTLNSKPNPALRADNIADSCDS